MKGFLKYYKWELSNELFTSIYFAGMLSMYCIEVLFHGERSIDILIMFEMLMLCYVISIIQKLVFRDDCNHYNKSLIIRNIIWFMSSILLVVIASILFHWFDNLQAWAIYAFIAYMIVFFITIWFGIHITNKIDTKNLNNLLSEYQEKMK